MHLYKFFMQAWIAQSDSIFSHRLFCPQQRWPKGCNRKNVLNVMILITNGINFFKYKFVNLLKYLIKLPKT